MSIQPVGDPPGTDGPPEGPEVRCPECDSEDTYPVSFGVYDYSCRDCDTDFFHPDEVARMDAGDRGMDDMREREFSA